MSLFPNPVVRPQQPPPSSASSNRRTIILILVSSGVAILATGGYALYRAGSWYSQHYLNIDQSQATFVATDEESVYRNPTFGVILRLPGRWSQPKNSAVGNFCTLQHPEKMYTALFQYQFISAQQTVDEFANSMTFTWVKIFHYTLISQDSPIVNGLPARRMTFESTAEQGLRMRMALLAVKKGHNLYSVILTSPFGDGDSWKELVNSLSHAVEIQ